MCLGPAGLSLCCGYHLPKSSRPSQDFECESGLMMMTQSRPGFCYHHRNFVRTCCGLPCSLSVTLSVTHNFQALLSTKPGVHPLFTDNVTTLTVFFLAWSSILKPTAAQVHKCFMSRVTTERSKKIIASFLCLISQSKKLDVRVWIGRDDASWMARTLHHCQLLQERDSRS